MAVTRGNGGKRPGGGGGRPRPDFTPSKTKGLFLRFDCVAGRAKIVGHRTARSCSRASAASTSTSRTSRPAGSISRRTAARARSSVTIATIRPPAPASAMAQVGHRSSGRDALRDDLRRRRDQGGPALLDQDHDGAPARGDGDAVGRLRCGHEAQGRRHRRGRDRRLGGRDQVGRQEVLPPALQDHGFREGPRGPFDGADADDD